MTNVTTKPELSHPTTESNSPFFDDWFDLIETGIRDRVRGLIEEMIRSELDAVLSHPRYGRRARHAEGSDVTAVVTGHRHGSRVVEPLVEALAVCVRPESADGLPELLLAVFGHRENAMRRAGVGGSS